MPLFDNHGRMLNYVRLAVTDRCNLRCFYCMPAQGIQYLPKRELLTFEEIERLVRILASLGVTKVRLTGGEPFLRNDLGKLIKMIIRIPGISELHLTTNGVLTAPHIPLLKEVGVASVNLSLDTLDRMRFKEIALRDEFEAVWKTYQELQDANISVKINAVVMEGKNVDDIIPFVELTRHTPLTVRFIEEMPFNGEGAHYAQLNWNYRKILEHITGHFGTPEKLEDAPSSTSLNYRIPQHKGQFGIIPAFSRTFCGTCNRIRVTAQGELKTCLYDGGVLNLRELLRSGAGDSEIEVHLLRAFAGRHKNGFEAEASRKAAPVKESMSTIGG
jgi:cyclic pyranopterin phosphate synthase